MNNATENKITYENNVSSEHEIKIDMTFGEALAITQQTYNYFAVKLFKNREEFFKKLNETIANHAKLNQENKQQTNSIEELISEYIKEDKNKYIKEMNKEINNFTLYDVTYDKKSNFSGLTYIYDNGNTVNVAIACRGSLSIFNPTGLWKDWICNNLRMIVCDNTNSDKYAQEYAKSIINKIKQQHSDDKKINIITLGHSKGGREAQKQMLALLNKNKDNNKVNICCLTFNSAPIVFYEFCQISAHKDYCQNLYSTDSLGIFKDILKLFNYFKYGNNCAYPVNKKFSWVNLILNSLLSFIATLVIYPYLENKITRYLVFPTALVVIIFLAGIILFYFRLPALIVLIVLVLTWFFLNPFIWLIFAIVFILAFVVLPYYTHGINVFKDEKSLYKKLKEKNVSKIIRAKDLDKL